MTERPGFMLYFELVPALASMDDGAAGALFKALMAYAQYGEVRELSGIAEFAFLVARPRIDRDNEVYQEKCRKNAYNAYAGACRRRGELPVEYEEWDGERTPANACERIPTTTPNATPNTKTKSISIPATAQPSGSPTPAAADSNTAWVVPFLEQERKKRGMRNETRAAAR